MHSKETETSVDIAELSKHLSSSDDTIVKTTTTENILGKFQKHSLEKLKNDRFAKITKAIQGLTTWAKWLIPIYLIVIGLILISNHYISRLSDSVLITLLGTTTANVLGLMYIVLKGYFKNIHSN